MGDPLRLYGLKALVLAGASGIGEATSRTLVKHGATVLAVDTDASGVEQHYRSVKGIRGHAASLNDPEKMPAIVDKAISRLEGIDILVNEFPPNAEFPLGKDPDAFSSLLVAREKLIASICSAAMPHIQKSPAGRIINIGYPESLFAADAAEAFRQSETDLARLTAQLAATSGGLGITANHVQPGAIMTPISREVFRKDKSLRDHYIAASTAARLGEPIDVAKVVLFLASDDAAFVNGAGIVVDGGRVSA